jgi:hypothetical protein
MNSRLLTKGRLGFLLFLISIGSVTIPSFLSAALPPDGALPPVTPRDAPDDAANPYGIIMERNIFHLNPQPPPPEPEKPKVELPVVKITGFVNIAGKSRVLFVSQPKEKKDGPIYYSLGEGEKSGDSKLELVKISPAQDKVDVINDGVAVTLTVTNDTLGAAPATAPVAQGGGPGPRPGMQPPGRMFPGQMNQGPPGMPGMPGANGLPFTMPRRRMQQ